MIAFARRKRSPIIGHGATLYINGKPVGGVENLEIVIDTSEPCAFNNQLPTVTTHVKFKSPNTTKE